MPRPITTKPKNVLALDLGGQTGWACLDATGQPLYGVLDLTTKGEGARSYLPALKLKQWLERQEGLDPACVPRWQDFNHIAFEETFARGTAKLRLDSLQTVTAVYCLEHGLDWSRVAATSLKKYATGHGHCGKEQMVEAVKFFFPSLRGKTLGYDEADALCVLAWALGYTRG